MRALFASLVLVGCAAPPVQPGSAPVKLWFGGDVHLGDGGLPPLPFEGVGVVNLEGPIGDGPFTAQRLVNAPTAAKALAGAGVKVAFVENNHADDDGEAGRRRTRAVLEAAGVSPAGVTVLPLGNHQVVFLGIDLMRGVLAEELEAARALGDVLVVGFHATAPALLLPATDLEVAVELALQHGASIVVSHGTHSIARVERRGNAVVAWGLGNLAFACTCTSERDGLVLEVELDSAGHAGAAAVVPVTAGLEGAAPGLSVQAELMFDVLRSLESAPLKIDGPRGRF